MIRKYVIWLFIVITWSQICDDVYGHVALTFPHARKYDLDFLDNARTPGPCGMPRGKYISKFFFYIIINYLYLPRIYTYTKPSCTSSALG